MLNTALILVAVSAVYFSRDMKPSRRFLAGTAYLAMAVFAFIAHFIK